MTSVSTALLLAAAAALQTPWTAGPPLPVPTANNGVGAIETSEGWEVYSVLGLDSSKLWSGVHARAFRFDGAWTELPPIPGPGRLATTVEAVRGHLYVFGGYTVAEGGGERSVPEVDVWTPGASAWARAAPFPVPTDDAVSGVLGDSLVYVVSGWHDTDNVADVQIYDAVRDRWSAGTPIPGPPVFGHTGGLSGRTIVYVDGVRVDRDPRRFVLDSGSWRGDTDPTDPTRIEWRRIADHPGPPLYRGAAVAVGPWVVFAGGGDNAYNYTGIGYDGRPTEPLRGVFAYHVEEDRWTTLPSLGFPTMDHRAIARVGESLWIVGGMVGGQRVTERVQIAEIEALLNGRSP